MNNYRFKNSEYTVIENTLRLQNIAIPILAELNKKKIEYTAGIDISEVEKFQNKISVLENEQKLDTEYLNEVKKNENEQEVIRVTKIVNERKILIDSLKKEFTEDDIMQMNLKIFNDAHAFALNDVITNDRIIIPFLKKYLIGDFTKLDFNDPAIIPFITIVMSDFFLSLQRKEKK